MKDGAALGYSHGLIFVEVGQQSSKDITVVMVREMPWHKIREEYKHGLGVPTLIAVARKTIRKAKAWQSPKHGGSTGGHRAGVLESSFVAEVKSDLMGEQTILCGMLQARSLLCSTSW
ncbi:hypothetical protein ACNKHM_12145 [Shigella sonnei]